MLGGAGVCANKGLPIVGHLRHRGPDLLTGDDEVVTVLNCSRLHTGEIGARAGLREEAAELDLRRRVVRQQLVPMPLVAVIHEDGADEVTCAGGRRAPVGHFLAVDQLSRDWCALPTKFLRPVQRPPAFVSEFELPILDEVDGLMGVEVVRGDGSADGIVILGIPLGGDKVAHLLSERLILL